MLRSPFSPFPAEGVCGAMRSPFPEVLRSAVKLLVGLGMLGLVLNSSPTTGFSSRARFPARATDLASRRSSLRPGNRAAARATEVSVERGKETETPERRPARLPEEHLLKPFFASLEEVLTRCATSRLVLL